MAIRMNGGRISVNDVHLAAFRTTRLDVRAKLQAGPEEQTAAGVAVVPAWWWAAISRHGRNAPR